ncbi:MAG: ribosome silencing factor [Candidatus Hydrogenedentes bacterium]|jgi:ribosome-associated protein|nr:ribosome silencing factor [Candidatus Hydrogenedentota bacterium]
MTKKATADKKDLLKKVQAVAEAVAGKKAKDIKAYNVSGLTLIADAFVLCTANSEPQLKAVANAARESVREAGYHVLRVEGDQRSGWLVIDFGDVILHVFRNQARVFYDLDRMWGDAPEIVLNLDTE